MIIKKIQESYIHLFQIVFSKNHVFLKTFNSEFQATEVWFTDKKSQPLEIQDRINLTSVIK